FNIVGILNRSSRPLPAIRFAGKKIFSIPQTGHSCKPHHFGDINDRNADKVIRLRFAANFSNGREDRSLVSVQLNGCLGRSSRSLQIL
ncbi:MAG: hypothetical protein WBD37_09290, partial [Anderseniella sp.]